MAGPLTSTSELIGAGRPRLAVIDNFALATPLDPYLSLRALASYSAMSVRWLRAQLDDPRHPLPCYRLGGKIVVRRSEYDHWAQTYRRAGRPDVDVIVNEVLRGLR